MPVRDLTSGARTDLTVGSTERDVYAPGRWPSRGTQSPFSQSKENQVNRRELLKGAAGITTCLVGFKAASAGATTASVPATPPHQAEHMYQAGQLIWLPVATTTSGQSFQANFRRIQTPDGAYFMLVSFLDKKVAISERDGAFWDASQDLYDNLKWQFAPMGDVLRIIWLFKFFTQDLYMAWLGLLVIGFIMLIIAAIYLYFRDLRFKEHMREYGPRDPETEESQQHNLLGIPMWMHPRGEVAGHTPSFHEDMAWLAAHHPGLGQELRNDSRVGAWLDTGNIYAGVF